MVDAGLEAVGPDRGRAPPGLPLLWAVGLAGVVATGAAIPLGAEQEPARIALAVWTPFPYVLAGLIAWRRKPASRFGPLMVGAGFAFSVSTLQWAHAPLPTTVGQLVDLLPAVLFLHVFLAFPSGQLEGRAERLLVAVGYAAAIGLQVVVLMLGGFGDPTLLAVRSDPATAEVVQDVQLLTISAASLAGVVVLAARRRAVAPARRRPTTLLLDAFTLGLVLMAALLIAGTFQLPGFEQLRLATFTMIGLAPVAFLAALLDARLARSGVGDLLVELRSHPAVDLRDALARTLRDPSLTLAYWLPQLRPQAPDGLLRPQAPDGLARPQAPDGLLRPQAPDGLAGSWVDGEGRPVTLPTGDDRRSTTLVDRGGAHVAALVHDAALEDERELLDAVSAAAGFALENGQLQAELRAGLLEVQASRSRVVEAAQKERQRLERDLHDGAQQRLVALALELDLLGSRLAAEPDARERVERVKQEVNVSLAELRDLARGLHPAVVSDHGLAVALESLAARAPLPLRLTVRLDGRPPEPVEVGAYFVVCEALANIGKHAHATSAAVAVTRTEGQVVVEVTDDGVGGAAPGHGLRGLADRVEALGGHLTVDSPTGGGTRVSAAIPCV